MVTSELSKIGNRTEEDKKNAASGTRSPDTAKSHPNGFCRNYSAFAESQQALVESQQALVESPQQVVVSSTAAASVSTASAFFALLPQAEAATIRATTATDINTFFIIIIIKTKSNFYFAFKGQKYIVFRNLQYFFPIFFIFPSLFELTLLQTEDFTAYNLKAKGHSRHISRALEAACTWVHEQESV